MTFDSPTLFLTDVNLDVGSTSETHELHSWDRQGLVSIKTLGWIRYVRHLSSSG